MTEYPRSQPIKDGSDEVRRDYDQALVSPELRPGVWWTRYRESTSSCGNCIDTIRSTLLALPVLVGMTALAPARGHDWYPNDCCHDIDCAPVESMVRLVPAGGGESQIIVASKHGKASVPLDFPVRESKDSRMHVCLRRQDSGGMDLICLFMPPGM
jgi:hypothetical protein